MCNICSTNQNEVAPLGTEYMLSFLTNGTEKENMKPKIKRKKIALHAPELNATLIKKS